MEVKTSNACLQCINLTVIEELVAKEKAAAEAGKLVAEGSFVCLGVREYRRRGQSEERCRITDFQPPEFSDPALTKDTANLRPDIGLRPAS